MLSREFKIAAAMFAAVLAVKACLDIPSDFVSPVVTALRGPLALMFAANLIIFIISSRGMRCIIVGLTLLNLGAVCFLAPVAWPSFTSGFFIFTNKYWQNPAAVSLMMSATFATGIVFSITGLLFVLFGLVMVSNDHHRQPQETWWSKFVHKIRLGISAIARDETSGPPTKVKTWPEGAVKADKILLDVGQAVEGK